jgi:hypothetical protein
VGIGDEASGKGCSIDIARKGRLDGEVSPVQEEIGLKVASSFLDAVGFLKPDLGDDGLHPNAKGYRVMAPVALDAITKTLAPAPAAVDPKQRRRRGNR